MPTRLDDVPRVPIDSRAQWRVWRVAETAALAARNERANRWQLR